ncbi:hypothetical protein Tco_0956097 [Tanacetum coccineum]|uniref:Integrase zinc-binding domain-containing protein n=1 Tax=Tanacetum coccineum TaxID=301880 RepID=A0ABQ5E9W3_9ASTR
MSYTNLTISFTLESDKIYHNLKQFHQWPVMEESIATYVSKCLTCSKMRDDNQKPSGLQDPIWGCDKDLSDEEEIDWIDSKEDDEKKDDTDDDKSREQVNDDEDEEMLNAEVEDCRKGDAELSNVANANAKNTKEAKDDSKKVELPLTSSSLSISLDVEISSLLDIKIQYEIPHIQSLSVLKVLVFVIFEPSDLTPVQEAPSAAPVTTLRPPSVSTIPPAPLQQTTAPIHSPPITTDAPTITTVIYKFDALSAVQLRVAKLEKDVFALKKIDHSAKALATLKSQVPTIVEQYLGSKIGDDLQKDENAMDEGVANTVKDQKRNHVDDDDEDPLAGPNQGKKIKRRRTKESESFKKPSTTKETPKAKALSKGSKTSKSASAKEPVKEQIAEVVMDDAGEDMVHDYNQPHDTYEPKTAKTPNPEWFKQPLRPPTPDPKWNKRQVVLGRPGHLTVAADYFFNNDLEYLKYFDLERTYTTSITKTKAALYEIVGIEDMVLTLWVTIKHEYDKDAAKGIKHWGERRKLWYRSQMNKFSKQNVYSTQKILGVKSVSVKKLHGCGYLEEITFPEIEFKELYTPSYKPPGVIYEDLTKLKRVMRVDELYKFSDGILKKVQDELHQRILDFCLGYNKEM